MKKAQKRDAVRAETFYFRNTLKKCKLNNCDCKYCQDTLFECCSQRPSGSAGSSSNTSHWRKGNVGNVAISLPPVCTVTCGVPRFLWGLFSP